MRMSNLYARQCRDVLDELVAEAGGVAALARTLTQAGLPITAKTIGRWRLTHLSKRQRPQRQAKIPAAYVNTVARVTGRSARELRPDLFASGAEAAYVAGAPPASAHAHSAVLGGSIADRRYYCAASYTLERGVLEARHSAPQTNAAAERGSALHALMEWYGTDRDTVGGWEPWSSSTAQAEAFFTRRIGVKIGTHEVTDTDVQHGLLPAVVALKGVLRQYPRDAAVLSEQRVSLPGIPGAFGTADMIVVSADTVHIMDYKFGFRPERPERNFGLVFYWVAARVGPELQQYMATTDAQQARVTIIQPTKPRATHAETWDIENADVLALEVIQQWKEHCKLQPALHAGLFTPGWHCTYCAAAPVCAVAHTQSSGSRTQIPPVLPVVPER